MKIQFRCAVFAVRLAFSFPAPASAWSDVGHKQIAAVAYVNELIRHHLAYLMWVNGLEGGPADEADQAAFVNVAVWADDIEAELNCRTLGAPGCYQGGNEADPVGGPMAGKNLGTIDHLIHDYWHYYDIPFSPEGAQTADFPVVSALSQIKLLSSDLADPKSSEDLKSFGLVWLLHLAGDAHQPLLATQRFTKDISNGDRGGNEETVDIGLAEKPKLHALWDGLLGDSGPASAAIAAAAVLPPADPAEAEISDPSIWFTESFEIAKRDFYTAEIGPGKGPYTVSEVYLKNDKTIAQERAAIAGARIGNSHRYSTEVDSTICVSMARRGCLASSRRSDRPLQSFFNGDRM
ncbi:S1/P1 nuclease [Ensifer sp. ENS04]|uniref:S1/P1 nuclease n=1 Tax=Ensifer sp. ENS04 TaxID=2769281 RepID=UPI00177BF2EB|nr:S1/P1 nuclease [Ensifer sp. ENS04]MBD9544522.1 S1/P1 nuclease [Ensifer sp. ENS04]